MGARMEAMCLPLGASSGAPRVYTPLGGPRSRTSGVMSCDLNPQPVSSGNGFDYNSIKNSVTQNLVESQSKPQAPASVVPRGGNTDADDERTEQILNNTRRLSRFSPFCPADCPPPISNGCTPRRVPRVLGKSRFDA